MRIFVPTRSRVDRQITRREFFLDEVATLYPVTYIVPLSERAKALSAWGRKYDDHTIAVPDSYTLSDIRQWLVYNWDTDQLGHDPFQVCMDDDLVFLRRWAPRDIRQRSRGTKANPITSGDAFAAFRRMEFWLTEGYIHGALSQRGGNNTVAEPFKVIGRATDCHFYNAKVIAIEKIKINAVILRQDFHLTLSLLELGYENVIDYEFMSGQTDGKPGGCQVYRTLEMLEQQAHELALLHPEFVTIVQKERKGGFGTSVDVRMSWQKSYGSRSGERKWHGQPEEG